MRRRLIALVLGAMSVPAADAADESRAGPATPSVATESAPARSKQGPAVWIAIGASMIAVMSALAATLAASKAKADRVKDDLRA